MSPSQLLRSVLVAAMLVCVAVTPAFAQEDDDGEGPVPMHPLTDMPDAATDVRTSFILPVVVNNVFSIAEVTTVVLGFQNTGSKNYNVTSIWGALTSPFQSRMFIQNFTGRPYGRVVEGGAEASFEYRFMPSPELEPMDLQLVFSVFYEDESSMFATTFFNQTVTFEDRRSPFDFRSSIKLVTIVAVIGAIVYFLLMGTGTKKTARKAKSAAAASGAATVDTTEFAQEFLARTQKAKSSKKE